MTTLGIRSMRRLARACELRRNLPRPLLVASGAFVLLLATASAPRAQEHTPAAPGEHGAASAEHGGEHGGLSGLIWPTANFLVLAGALYYFLRTPFTEYLSGRSSQIRKDLVDAAELNRTATAQLAEVDRKMKALPGELEALKARGAQEITAEEERIASAAAADRARLLTQTRREIEVRLQSAQRELSDHAAELALKLATERLSREMSPADHARLVDRYVDQVKGR